ncbi:MAG: hypothetical protein A2Y65_06240 [Deltaproteobacteria bacterium RBG_13_52_11]|nr:MAG: hypothetical protein A2Y65_06240 [Deltaproteobacteria bacterium RBG_13_52_11]
MCEQSMFVNPMSKITPSSWREGGDMAIWLSAIQEIIEMILGVKYIEPPAMRQGRNCHCARRGFALY